MHISRFFLPFCTVVCLLFSTVSVQAETIVDIYGPGQQQIPIAMASPLKGPSDEAVSMGRELHNAIQADLNLLPFVHLVSQSAVLGGTVLPGWKADSIDFKRFQIAGANLMISAYWPGGDSSSGKVELRVFETYSGKFIFGNAYPVASSTIFDVADEFCDDLMFALTGSRGFFKSRITFVKGGGFQRDVWVVRPSGRDLQQLTHLKGCAMSPSWSPDGSKIVFSHIDDSTHALGIWDSATRQTKRIRFPGNTVIGPAFLGNNVAVSLSSGKYPDIFLLNDKFQKSRALEQSPAINCSPSFDKTGTKMAFTSSRHGSPQVFLKDLSSGAITRISTSGSYNSEPCISPDGTLIAYTKGTGDGFRIFVHDMITHQEQQISFGPGRDEQPSFGPDSYFVAFVSSREGAQQIYLTTRHGGEAKKVPTGSGNALFPRWGR